MAMDITSLPHQPGQFDASEINKNHFMKGWGKGIFST
jgi:hypothetical protein